MISKGEFFVTKKPTARPLTPVELQIMTAIWNLGEATVKEVQNALPKERALAYTTVATMMKILEGKKILKSRKTEKAHLFIPVLTREEYGQQSLKALTTGAFAKNPTWLVKQLLEKTELTEAELKEIRHLVAERLGE